jgi:proline iminopeptidase
MKYIITLISLSIFINITNGQNLEPREGFVKVEGGKIWYKIVGSGKGIPLLRIHGGPGSRSCGSIPGYSLLGDERSVIFYDQLGSGFSDRPTDTLLWQLPRFVNEIDSLRKALSLKELHIIGDSWGSAVLIEYMLSKKPNGVQSVVFSGPLLSTPIWIEDAKILLRELPKNIQDTIQKYEELKDYSSSSYIKATHNFYNRFLSVKGYPLISPPECDGSLGFNVHPYNYMWGPTEFNATGTLKTFDRTSRLHELKQPVLFIAGQYDEARPETMYRYQKMVPNSKVIIIENSGHKKAIDQPVLYTNELRKFFKSVEIK